ncbi:MAG: hypothetical protein ACERIH_11360 [Labilibaculum antarcticum]
MNEILVIVEKSKLGFCAYHKGEYPLKVEALNLVEIKEKVNIEVSKKWYEKIKNRPCPNDRNDCYPVVRYYYDVKKLLNYIKPYVKQKALSDRAGLTEVALSYLMNGKRNVSEKTFILLVKTIHYIVLELSDYCIYNEVMEEVYS